MKGSRIGGIIAAAMALSIGEGVLSCGAVSESTPADAGNSGASTGLGPGLFATSGTSGGPCEKLECQQVACSGGITTTVSGTVYDPAGKVPLYNVVVYVPNAEVEPFPEGASCDQCGATLSGDPVVSTLTDTRGRFVLENVPVGADIPLVMQVGKWRRQIVLPAVAECTDNPLTDASRTSMPSNRSEGDIPRMALTTGGADPFECFLRKIGIDDSEFTPEAGPGRVNVFAGHDGAARYAASMNGGAPFSPATSLWSTQESLLKYDIVLLACEGDQDPDNKPVTALEAMLGYTSAGGRVFASHWHNYWLDSDRTPTPFPKTATFEYEDDPPEPFTGHVDTGFPKGQALSDWLLNVGASSAAGEILIHQPQHTVDTVENVSQRWIYGEGSDAVQYYTFNTPVGVAEDRQCGRVVFSDIHVSSGDGVGDDFPDGCVSTDLSPQEKALLFMLFDLSSCIQPDDAPITPPPT